MLLLLVILGLILLLLEVIIGADGVVATAGVGSLALAGVVWALDIWAPVWADQLRGPALLVLFLVWGVLVVAAAITVRSLLQLQRHGPLVNLPERGNVTRRLDPEGEIDLGGIRYRARSENGESISTGRRVEVVRRQGRLMFVRDVDPTPYH